jgi:HSP20 family molecular chaperone IbpA
MKKRSISIKSGYVFHYRCPECHYLVEKELLFGQGCTICGWVSPLVMSRELNAVENSSHVDIIEEEDIIKITTELHMIDENNLKLDVNGNKLVISSGGFDRIIPLPYAVEQVIEKTYRNGVLGIIVKKISG